MRRRRGLCASRRRRHHGRTRTHPRARPQERLQIGLQRFDDVCDRRVLTPDGDRVAADHLKIGEPDLIHETSCRLLGLTIIGAALGQAARDRAAAENLVAGVERDELARRDASFRLLELNGHPAFGNGE